MEPIINNNANTNDPDRKSMSEQDTREHTVTTLANKLLGRFSRPEDLGLRSTIEALFKDTTSRSALEAVKKIGKNCAELREDPTLSPFVNQLLQDPRSRTEANANQASTASELAMCISTGQLAKLETHAPNLPCYAALNSVAETTNAQAPLKTEEILASIQPNGLPSNTSERSRT